MIRETIVGVISDTHNLVRPEVIDILKGSDLIVHAGDVGSPHILDILRRLAPVYAVRGNTDRGALAAELPGNRIVRVGETKIFVLHDITELELPSDEEKCSVVISGHTHIPEVLRHKGVLYLNPGSAGPKRVNLPVSLARLRIGPEKIEEEQFELNV